MQSRDGRVLQAENHSICCPSQSHHRPPPDVERIKQTALLVDFEVRVRADPRRIWSCPRGQLPPLDLLDWPAFLSHHAKLVFKLGCHWYGEPGMPGNRYQACDPRLALLTWSFDDSFGVVFKHIMAVHSSFDADSELAGLERHPLGERQPHFSILKG